MFFLLLVACSKINIKVGSKYPTRVEDITDECISDLINRFEAQGVISYFEQLDNWAEQSNILRTTKPGSPDERSWYIYQFGDKKFSGLLLLIEFANRVALKSKCLGFFSKLATEAATNVATKVGQFDQLSDEHFIFSVLTKGIDYFDFAQEYLDKILAVLGPTQYSFGLDKSKFLGETNIYLFPLVLASLKNITKAQLENFFEILREKCYRDNWTIDTLLQQNIGDQDSNSPGHVAAIAGNVGYLEYILESEFLTVADDNKIGDHFQKKVNRKKMDYGMCAALSESKCIDLILKYKKGQVELGQVLGIDYLTGLFLFSLCVANKNENALCIHTYNKDVMNHAWEDLKLDRIKSILKKLTISLVDLGLTFLNVALPAAGIFINILGNIRQSYNFMGQSEPDNLLEESEIDKIYRGFTVKHWLDKFTSQCLITTPHGCVSFCSDKVTEISSKSRVCFRGKKFLGGFHSWRTKSRTLFKLEEDQGINKIVLNDEIFGQGKVEAYLERYRERKADIKSGLENFQNKVTEFNNNFLELQNINLTGINVGFSEVKIATLLSLNELEICVQKVTALL